MKKLFSLLLIANLIFAICSCTEKGIGDDSTPPVSYLDFLEEIDTSPEFDADGGSSWVEFTTSHDWTASSSQSWITLSRESGTPQKAYFTIKVSKNSSTSKRTGVVTITADNKNYKINVSQQGAAKTVFEFSSDTDTTPEFEAEGGTSKVSFTTSHDWTASADKSWISLSRKSGTTTNSNFTITVSENTTTSQRTGTVTITSNDKSYKITATQKGKGDDSLCNMECAPNEVLYKTKYGYTVTLSDESNFGANLMSNTYENGVGRLVFDADVIIGYAAFKECTSLIEVKFPDSVTSIGNAAFSGCSSLKSVTIGNSVTKIGSDAFYGCSCLTSITIPNSITNIGSDAFYGCTGELIINSKIIETDYTVDNYPKYYGWLYGSKFTKLTIGDNITKIGNLAFYYCSSLTSVTIGNSVTSIGGSAFAYCSSLPSVTIPNSVTSIRGGAFGYCSSLTSVTIPDSVTSIGENTFYNCDSLTSVTIGNSVTSIGANAFSGCTGELTVNCNIPSASSYYGGVFQGSNFTKVTIGDSVSSIGSKAFYRCSSLTSVTIGNNVTSIGYEAFYRCTSLTSVTIGNSVTTIGSYAFYDCSSLTNVTIPDSVTSIEERAFWGCNSLTSVYCKPTFPPAIYYWDGTGTSVRATFPLNSGMTIYVPRSAYYYYMWHDQASYGHVDTSNWYLYESYIQPYDFE